MALDKIEYSRLIMKRSTVSGDVPTVPPITATTLNDFTPNDIFVGEFFLNAVDDLLWIRTDTGILPIDLSGSTGTTIPSLTQVLFEGNNTGGYDIEVSSGNTVTFQGLTTGSTTNFLGLDVSGNTIVSGVVPGTPDLQSVLFQGNTTNGNDIEVSSGDTIVFNGLTTGSTTDFLGLDASGNTIVTSVSSGVGLYLPLSGGTVTGNTTFTQNLYLTNLTSGGSQTFLTVDSDTGQVYTATNPTFTGNYLPLSGGTVTGNTYFGATSGITMDQVNNRLGINTATPQHTIEAFGTKSRVTYENTVGGVLQISGDTFLPRFQVTAAPSTPNPLFSLNMGVRTWDDATYPGYGKVGDAFVYASNEANGLNIINRQTSGSTLEDYIRFYAGQDANGTTPDIHIQGSGATRGYIGFGTITPTEKVDVVGNVKITGQSYVALPATGTTTSATTINWNDGNVQEDVLGANTTFTFTNPKAGATYILVLRQSSGGGNTITWDPRVTWAGGTPPTMTTTANRFDVYTFIFDGNKYFGSYIQDFI
jgi:hypothetical protein